MDGVGYIKALESPSEFGTLHQKSLYYIDTIETSDYKPLLRYLISSQIQEPAEIMSKKAGEGSAQNRSHCSLFKDPNHSDLILTFTSGSGKHSNKIYFVPEDQLYVYERYNINKWNEQEIQENLHAIHVGTNRGMAPFSATSIANVVRWMANEGKRDDLTAAQIQHWNYIGVPEAKEKWDALVASNDAQTHIPYPSKEQPSLKWQREHQAAQAQASGSGAQSSQSST